MLAFLNYNIEISLNRNLFYKQCTYLNLVIYTTSNHVNKYLYTLLTT